jgi:hypothetical protein
MKSYRAQSRINWLQVETDVSGNICPHHQGYVTGYPEYCHEYCAQAGI